MQCYFCSQSHDQRGMLKPSAHFGGLVTPRRRSRGRLPGWRSRSPHRSRETELDLRHAAPFHRDSPQGRGCVLRPDEKPSPRREFLEGATLKHTIVYRPMELETVLFVRNRCCGCHRCALFARNCSSRHQAREYFCDEAWTRKASRFWVGESAVRPRRDRRIRKRGDRCDSGSEH